MILHWFHYSVVFKKNDSRIDGKSKGLNAARKYHFFGLRIVVFLWIFLLSTTRDCKCDPRPHKQQQEIIHYIKKSIFDDFSPVWSDSKRLLLAPWCPHQAALSLFSAMHLARLTTSRSATSLTLGLGEMRKNRWRRALELQVPFVHLDVIHPRILNLSHNDFDRFQRSCCFFTKRIHFFYTLDL